MGLRIEEDGESERSVVMREIGVALLGNITPRESEQTSVWSAHSRERMNNRQQEEKQMTVETTSSAAKRKDLLVRPLTLTTIGTVSCGIKPNAMCDGSRRVS
jgi:hypothetical protein